jgi:hypothetical protein
VIPGRSLDWYYRLLQPCRSIQGELKSADVWDRFRFAGGETRDRIWDGLSKVRIHIVDPRPYDRSAERLASNLLRCDDPKSLLQQQRAAKDAYAIWLSNRLQFYVAQQILSDSVGTRVHNLSRFLMDAPFMSDEQSDVLSLEDFGTEAKPIVRRVSEWSVKSAASFHEALDCFMEVDESTRFYRNDLIRKRMHSRVLDSHAFDSGHPDHVKLLETARGNILDNLNPFESERPTIQPRPYSEIESKDSFLVQAADIAAGIASKILEAENLVAVVIRFKYVT